MAKYLVRASYTADGARGLMKDGGSKRVQVVTDMMRSAGATLEALYFALGDYDAYAIIDAPDILAVTAAALAANATGAVHVSTTPLLTPQELDRAITKAVTYTPPGR
jgi:uncharacterized protein with GYD domain